MDVAKKDESPKDEAGNLVERFLKSESSYYQSLQMMQHLFLEPVAPLQDPRVAQVFQDVQPVVDLHALLWRRLEPFVGGESSLDTLQEIFLILLEYSSLFPVYISFFMSHDASQQLLRVVLSSSPKMAQLAKDASMLRPGTSMSSLLQVERKRKTQNRFFFTYIFENS
jgi:hypothetical protein